MVVYLSLLIPTYVIQSTKLRSIARLSCMGELIMIRDSSLTLSGLLSSDELNDVISHVCTSYIVGSLVCLFSCCILYVVYDLLINSNSIHIIHRVTWVMGRPIGNFEKNIVYTLIAKTRRNKQTNHWRITGRECSELVCNPGGRPFAVTIR